MRIVSTTLTTLLLLASSFSFTAQSKDYNAEELTSKYKAEIEQIAPDSSPYDIVESLSKVVFKSVTNAKAQGDEKTTKELMQLIVRQQLLPFVDVRFAAYKILGPQLKQSTKEERDLFVDAMERNLVDTYSSALVQYNNQEVRYEPKRDVSNQKMVAVRTELLQPGGKPLSMIFKLRKNSKTGEWKAYDLIVEGISLIDSKRAELSQPLRNDGIGQVAETLLEE
ncbi:phospholipid-binding protein MlaC [Psychrosphaera haliotis]|uniref:Toluene tolerance protein n=1 Tax=Psychrosphaera haliotis TaxID=555083 RepID=A0A6N8F6N5_9GAMM|nr:ABC transporter substrate-binding protein [Psychrosphaera haliotis]MUH71868.1 toluene tolerance protein [Psychrosphaera haliotis]